MFVISQYKSAVIMNISEHQKIQMQKPIIFTFPFYGSEMWGLTLREEYESKVYENRD